MRTRLDWEKLLSTKRVSDFDECRLTPQKQSQFEDPRSAFERDYDQLIFSYPFRRLQDKTQVIPFPEFDFVHTRLTHSLEVASVGRSFGKLAASIIFKELSADFIKQNKLCPSDIGALVGASCLAHDIGNPPFGHSGEDSISYYFSDIDQSIQPFNILHPNFVRQENTECYFTTYDYESKQHTEFSFSEKGIFPDTKKWCDLIKFEGNANGFRIITRNCERGINPTAALIGTFSKYPRESWLVLDPFSGLEKKDKPKSQLKYSFFQEQRELFKAISEDIGLIKIEGISEYDIAYRRHPLTFLMEAADDIAYQMIDFEDGCRLKLIDFDKEYIFIVDKKEIRKTPKSILQSIAELDNAFDIDKLNKAKDFKESISYLRAKVINVLIHSAFEIFTENYEGIMAGTFDKALVDCIKNSVVCKSLGEMKSLVREHVYNYKPVLESEASGFEVMSSLIESFAITSNICISCGDRETPKQLKLKSLLPKEFRPEEEVTDGNLTFDEKYKRVLKILDYVSGMTDNYAVSLFRRIKGISLPNS